MGAEARRGPDASLLRGYAWLFLAAGAAFVLLPGPLTRALGVLAGSLPGARAIAGAEPSLWLGLTGSMMAMIAFLSFSLARDPGQAVAWDVLLLSKGVSTLLFSSFAVVGFNTLFLVGAAVDGGIFLHLLVLRVRADERSGEAAVDAWRSRFAALWPRGYEVWFIKLNAAKSGNALWLRYTLRRTQEKSEGSCWYVLFDARGRRVLKGRWDTDAAGAPGDGELCRIGKSVLRRDGASAEGPGVKWDIRWETSGVPAFGFVPEVLYRAGVAGTLYCTPLPAGKFRGEAVLGGKKYAVAGASGAVGHLWGRRMGDNWRWAHAVFPDGETVFEILSAQGKAGGLRTPRWTAAHLWYKGKHYRSAGLCRGFMNSTEVSDNGWTFRADFGDFRIEGECAGAPDLTAELEYSDVDERKLLCRNSKTGSLRLSVVGKGGERRDEFETKDAAAVESVEGQT